MLINKDVKTEFAAPERLHYDCTVEQYQKLISSEDLHLVYDYTPDFIMILNEYRQIVFANKTLIEFLKKKCVHDIIGSRPGEILQCKEAFKNPGGCGTAKSCRACGAAKAIIQSRYNMPKTEECYIQTLNGDKSYNFRIWTSRPWKNQDYTLFVIRDIADEKFRNALEQTFFHDLTNAACDLQGILGLMDSREACTKYMPLLKSLSHKIFEEINSQRDLRYAEEGTINIHTSTIDSLKFIEKLVAIYESQKISRNISLCIADDSEKVLFISDERLLFRVIENMLKNAIEASSPGQKVTIRCKKDGKNVLFSVHNCSHIDENIQSNIFKRSFSTKAQGRGWGTYSIKLLTERYLNGSIDFISSPMSGTTFYAWYPLDCRKQTQKSTKGKQA